MESQERNRVRQKLFSDLLLGGSDNKIPGLDILNERYEYSFEPGNFQALVLKLDSGKRRYDGYTVRTVMEEMCANLQRILMKYCYEIEVMHLKSTSILICNYTDRNQPILRKELERAGTRFLHMQHQFWEMRFTVGVGSVVRDCRDLPLSIVEATDAVKERIVNDEQFCFEVYKGTRMSDMSLAIGWFCVKFHEALDVRHEYMIEGLMKELRTRVESIRDMSGKEFLDLIFAMGSYAISTGMKCDYRKEVERFVEELDGCASSTEVFELLNVWITEIVCGEKEDSQKRERQAVQEAKAYIQNHYKEPISLTEVAERVGFSPTYFSSIFKKQHGVGYSKYLSQLRMEEAKQLLVTTRLSVRSVCEEVGYSDLKHFTTSFCRYVGVMPGEYRKKYG